MKRRILVRIVLVLILLLALYPLTKFVILPLFDTSGELEGHDVPLYGYSEPDTPMVMENDALRFELDPATTHFTLTDKRTGHVWLSSPDNADSDPIALPVEKNKLNSTLSLTYAASTGMTTQFTSQEHSISPLAGVVMRIGDKLNFQRRIVCAIQLRCHCVLLYLISAFSTPLRTVPGRVISIQPSLRKA